MNGRLVTQEKTDHILDAAILAPTATVLQPFEMLEVTYQVVREKIRAIGCRQSVITDCSHILFFAAWGAQTAERIDTRFDLNNIVHNFANVSF